MSYFLQSFHNDKLYTSSIELKAQSDDEIQIIDKEYRLILLQLKSSKT